MNTTDQSPDGWHLHPNGLPARARHIWWQQLWDNAVRLNDRYRPGLRSPWWEDSIQVEALAALAAWVEAFDSGAWTDPAGKLTLLFDIERIRAVFRTGDQRFDVDNDIDTFVAYIAGDEGT
jgi:hypothetical protein